MEIIKNNELIVASYDPVLNKTFIVFKHDSKFYATETMLEDKLPACITIHDNLGELATNITWYGWIEEGINNNLKAGNILKRLINK